MNFTWITLAVGIVVGLTKLLTYLLGDKRKLRILKDKESCLEINLRTAISVNDTVAISAISVELDKLRKKIRDIERK